MILWSTAIPYAWQQSTHGLQEFLAPSDNLHIYAFTYPLPPILMARTSCQRTGEVTQTLPFPLYVPPCDRPPPPPTISPATLR